MQIEREDGTVIPVVGSEVEIHSGDLLTFVGKVDGVRELRNIPGLLPTNQKEKPIQPNANRVLVEAGMYFNNHYGVLLLTYYNSDLK